MQSEMEMFLQIGGVVVPFFSAFAGLFIWGLRRIDRRFDEAAAGRKRIEVQLGERCDRIEKEFKERCGRIEEHCGRIEERCDRIETQLGERCDRIEREFKGAARVAVEAAPG